MSSLFLVGFMGSGKSATASALARLLNVHAIDLDAEIEQRLGRTIATIFAEEGEPIFRSIEAETLADIVGSDQRAVVALGGGTWCEAGNRDLIRATGGISVFLDVPWSAIADRLPAADPSRPLFARSTAEALYRARRPDYARAELTIQLEGSEQPAAVAEVIALALEEAPCAI